MNSVLLQYKNLVFHFFRQEFSSKERLLTPVLFSLVILLVFAFSTPDLSDEWRLKMLVAQTLISSFLALQISLARSFEVESQDRVFDMIRVYPTNTTVFVLSKLTIVLISSLSTFVATTLIAALLHGYSLLYWFTPQAFLVVFLTLGGITSLGVLLAAITLKSESRQVLFPVLFFPLTAPILIAASETLSDVLSKPAWNETTIGWCTLLGACFAIFLTLSVLLGGEALSNE